MALPWIDDDTPSAMREPGWWSALMSLHKVTAGDGYTQLTQQVAVQDATERGYRTLGEYFAQRGESPGRWLGTAPLLPSASAHVGGSLITCGGHRRADLVRFPRW
jgi:hypothetical protein